MLSSSRSEGDANSGTTAAGLDTIKAMKDTLAALPQFQEMKSRFSAHISIAQLCMKKFQEDRLASAANYEQTMATGKTATGQEMKSSNVLNDLVPLLTDEKLSSDCKTRLIMLYFLLAKRSMDVTEKKRLFDYAKLAAIHQLAISKLQNFGLSQTAAEKESTSGGNNSMTTAFGTKMSKGFLSSLFKAASLGSSSKKKNEQLLYELSRYMPPLKIILKEWIEKLSLSDDIYPPINPHTSSSSSPTNSPIKTAKPSSLITDYRMGAKSLRKYSL
jgi:Sec1 family